MARSEPNGSTAIADSPWVVEEAADEAFDPGSTVMLSPVERLRYLPGRRAVWKAACTNGEDLLLKAYEVHPKQVRDAEREWRLGKKLAEAGLKVAKPLFKARHADGRVGVAFAFLPHGETLDKRVTAETLSALFQVVAAQHEAGFYQTDNHLGNYLATHDGVTMLDPGTFQTKNGPLTEQDRLQNLAILCATIPLQKRRLMNEALSNYFEESLAIEDNGSTRDSLAEAIREALDKRLRRYLKKTTRTCTEFVHEKHQGQRWLACRDLSPSLAKKLRENPDAFFEGQSLLKDGNTCSVVQVRHEGKPYVLKRYNRKGLGYRLRHLLTRPRALRSWSDGHALRSFGVSTPRPMACYTIYEGLLLREAYLLMDAADGTSLHETPQPEKMATAFACLQKELHLLQATHGDMKASNFIVSHDETLTLIDLDSFCFHRTNWSYKRHAARDLARFLKNWRNQPEVLAAFRDALGMKFAIFIQHYFPFGGLQRDALRLAEAAEAAGDEPTLVVSTWDGPKPATIPVTELRSGGLTNHGKAQRFTNACQDLLADFDTSIGFHRVAGVPFHFCGDACIAERFVRSGKSSFAKLLPRYRSQLQAECAVFGTESQTRLFFLAQKEADDYQRHYQLDENRFTLLPPWLRKPETFTETRDAVRNRLLSEIGLEDSAKVLLFVGSNYRLKRLDRIVDALSLLDDSVHLAVCGTDDFCPDSSASRYLAGFFSSP